MAGPKIPYPPSPRDVPDDLTDYPASYRSQQTLLLAGLFVFLMFYFAMIALCVLLGTYCLVTLNGPLAIVKLLVAMGCGIMFLFLVKGFFKRQPVEKELQIEITEEEQPILFGFIHRLCEELDAPEPHRVFATLDVNAAVRPRTSLINLFLIEPKKDLIIGLGLVNVCNLSEFKSVMAHEFGHFSQSAHASSYSYVAVNIILNLVIGEDWFDRMVNWCKNQDNAMSIIGHAIGVPLWIGRKVLEVILKAITLQRLAVSREQEFHADLVAVKAAGSDAVVLSLMRLRFGNLCLMQAIEDLHNAAQHQLYTRDLFHHQERAEPIVRRRRKAPELGVRPDSTDPMAGEHTRVFDPEQEELEHDEVPEMRRTHPPAHETEDNAKATFIPAVVDIRSPWVLFTDTDDLKERLTYKFYRMAMRIPKDTELADPEEVQQYIDNEHIDTTYDPKYHGAYDGRPLEPGDLAELNQQIRESPWGAERLEKMFRKLYEDVEGKTEEYNDLLKEHAILENTPGEKNPRIKKKIKKLDDELARAWDWYKTFDRRVYLIHVQMAARAHPNWRDELVERYQFHLEVQRMWQEAKFHHSKADAYITYLFSQSPNRVSPGLVAEVMHVLRQAWRALKKIHQVARDINLPAMRNFEEGERLADFILPGKLVSEPPLSYIKGKWVYKLLTQLQTVKTRCFRLHYKSVGGILALQEQIAAKWHEAQAPVEAVVLDPMPAVAAQVIDAQVIDAQVIDAQLVPGLLYAHVIDAEVVTAPQAPTPPVLPPNFPSWFPPHLLEVRPTRPPSTPVAEGAVTAFRVPGKVLGAEAPPAAGRAEPVVSEPAPAVEAPPPLASPAAPTPQSEPAPPVVGGEPDAVSASPPPPPAPSEAVSVLPEAAPAPEPQPELAAPPVGTSVEPGTDLLTRDPETPAATPNLTLFEVELTSPLPDLLAQDHDALSPPPTPAPEPPPALPSTGPEVERPSMVADPVAEQPTASSPPTLADVPHSPTLADAVPSQPTAPVPSATGPVVWPELTKLFPPLSRPPVLVPKVAVIPVVRSTLGQSVSVSAAPVAPPEPSPALKKPNIQRPAAAGRPAVWITWVAPGETSPLQAL